MQTTETNAFPRNPMEHRIADIIRREYALASDRPIWRAERLTEDLGGDSLAHLELMMTIETEFDVEISDDAAEAVKTIGDLCNTITTLNAAKPENAENAA
ncbi:acyl carrier protein [Hyphococcus sp.]|uniref:acyl carrier protein n=1 Tax=Hyphococcus sp. TaxID=2038636 RepID=UPI00207D87DA|nr:MAG: hypothetical protein DHS20C04_32330 [Marinicaulis sp.]